MYDGEMERSLSNVSSTSGISHRCVQELMRKCPSADFNLVQDAVVNVLRNPPEGILQSETVLLNWVVNSVQPIFQSDSVLR